MSSKCLNYSDSDFCSLFKSRVIFSAQLRFVVIVIVIGNSSDYQRIEEERFRFNFADDVLSAGDANHSDQTKSPIIEKLSAQGLVREIGDRFSATGSDALVAGTTTAADGCSM